VTKLLCIQGDRLASYRTVCDGAERIAEAKLSVVKRKEEEKERKIERKESKRKEYQA
jgi:hypothetical protein